MKLLNIGCGRVFAPGWINLDVEPASPDVHRWDARRGLPFAAGEIDAVYHAHLLEHLDAHAGQRFLRECARVLRPGGVLRVVVPDLEGIARAYLAALADARAGGDGVLHQWTRLELVDQLAREQSGGLMLVFARGLDASARSRVMTRAGAELPAMLSEVRVKCARRLLRGGWRRARSGLLLLLAQMLGGGAWREAVRAGLFRASGEVHRTMYDSLVLEQAVMAAGFEKGQVMSATTSAIPDFARYELDATGADGVSRKPDSLYYEAIKT
jgi:SAM-dependent methyltransferase